MSEPSLDKIQFDFIKSSLFRTARVDGIWGSINGYYDLILNFYSERPPIPQRVVHSFSERGVGDELPAERVIREAIVREVEISLSMNVHVAKLVRDWLDQRIKYIEEAKGAESQRRAE